MRVGAPEGTRRHRRRGTAPPPLVPGAQRRGGEQAGAATPTAHPPRHPGGAIGRVDLVPQHVVVGQVAERERLVPVEAAEQPGQAGQPADGAGAVGAPGEVRLEAAAVLRGERAEHVGAVPLVRLVGHLVTPRSCSASRSARIP